MGFPGVHNTTEHDTTREKKTQENSNNTTHTPATHFHNPVAEAGAHSPDPVAGAGVRKPDPIPVNPAQSVAECRRQSVSERPAEWSASDVDDVDDVDVVADALISLGVSEGVARSLAGAHPEEQIRRQIAWLPLRQPDNPGGMIVKAIVENWATPGALAGKVSNARTRELAQQRGAVSKLKMERDEQAARALYREAFDSLPLDDQAKMMQQAEASVAAQQPEIARAAAGSPPKQRLYKQAVISARNRILHERGLVETPN